jgi:oxygen-independent coproporphyrinogen-3 oxidase
MPRWEVLMGSPFSQVDFDLLKKYDRPGPRYTSYPTAPVFRDTFTAEDYRSEILATNIQEGSADLSLYFHFPFCDTLCYFCGCTMLVTRDRARIEEYQQYLKREIDMIAPLIGRNRKVVQLHWGGGTPTHLTPEQIGDIAGYIRSSFTIAPEAEVSVEIDPRELQRGHLEALRAFGFNRMSMGVQDFDPKVQEAVNRVQPEEMTWQVYSWARELGFTSINLDLIYGLPFQTLRGFETTVRKVIDYSPERIAVFNYAHVPWLKPHQKLIQQKDLPTPDQKLAILKQTINLFCSNGYEYIGMDHFARPNDELAIARKEKTLYRNFQGYSTKAGADLYGFGMSSISHFQTIYAQNEKNLLKYYGSLNEGRLATHVGYRMTEDDKLRKHVIMRLMCDLELDTHAVEQKFGIVFTDYFADSLASLHQFVDEGMVTLTDGKFTIVGAGRLLLRNIAMCFDAYLDSMAKNKPLFSRTV